MFHLVMYCYRLLLLLGFLRTFLALCIVWVTGGYQSGEHGIQ